MTLLLLQLVHILAGFVVLAEALNKLERCAPFRPGLTPHERLIDAMKAIAWIPLALGGGGALAGPVLSSMGTDAEWLPLLLHAGSPSLAEALTMLGVAVLIVRTRVKEG